VESAAYHVNDSQPLFSFVAGSPLAVSGSLRPVDGGSVAAVILDETIPLPVLSGQYLFPIGEASHNLAAAHAGFYAQIATRGLSEGAHVLTAYQVLPGERYRRIMPPRLFFLTDAGGKLSRPAIRALDRGPGISGLALASTTCLGGSYFDGRRGNDSAYRALAITGAVPQMVAGRFSAVWLLDGDRPIPARYDERSGRFIATIPREIAQSKAQVISAYGVTTFGHASVRLGRLVVQNIGTVSRAAPPRRLQALCRDTLEQLAGI
jgi:hypothetical protein